MLSNINILIITVWLLSAAFDYAEFCYLWQLKQYRWDRFRDFFATEQGRLYWLRYPLLFRSVLACSAFFWPMNEVIIIKYAILLFFAVDILFIAERFFRKKIRFPKKTIKAALLIFVSILIEGGLFIFGHEWHSIFLLSVIRLPIISFTVAILYIPTRAVREYFIFKAKKKLGLYKHLTVIGITGSYGKTSTKDFLAHILSKKFRVVKTQANQNNDYGIAKTILNNDLSKADILIVEMGAYRVGDIDLYCRIVHPKIGILTGINEQHLSLFGSIENIQKAKYALLRSLPSDGLAITNSDNKYCREFLSQLSAPVQTFGRQVSYNPTCRIDKAEIAVDSAVGVYALGSEKIEVTLPFPGVQYVENVAPCVLVAKHLGISTEQIIEACHTLPAPEQGRIVHYGSALIIDNTYNSNPAGFEASLELLKKIGEGRKKIVITRGMMELGSESNSLHEKIGKKIGEIADELVVITPDFVVPLKSGVGQNKIEIKELFKPEEIIYFLEGIKNSNTVILIENRISELVKQKIYSK